MTVHENLQPRILDAVDNFAATFRGFEIRPLPAATQNLLAELKEPEPEIHRLVKVISASPELSVKVLRTVNSSLYSLGHPVTNLQHAVAMLSVRRIRALALTYSMKSAVPRLDKKRFNHEAFWSDSLLRALLARGFARGLGRDEAEDAFTVTLLADVALPVLLSVWREYYESVIGRWRYDSSSLCDLERQEFGWDHAQAGAWILRFWKLPETIINFVAMHNTPQEEIVNLGLEKTIAPPVAIAALAPSVLKPIPERAARLVKAASEVLSFQNAELAELFSEIEQEMSEISQIFDIKKRRDTGILDLLVSSLNS